MEVQLGPKMRSVAVRLKAGVLRLDAAPEDLEAILFLQYIYSILYIIDYHILH